MQRKTIIRMLMIVISVLYLSVLFGCAGREYAPKDPYPYWFYHKELPAADRAVAEARKAGKDKECPPEFKAAEDLKNKAYEVYAACHTEEAIAMANDAAAKAKALCPPKPAQAAEPAPEIKPETKAEIKPAPKSELMPAPKPDKVIDRMTLNVNFDFDKTNIRKGDLAQLKKAIDFVKKYHGAKIKLEGNADSTGTKKYNQKLSERRADAVMHYLIKEGSVDKAVISAIGYGETKPIASNKTKAGRAKNRRVDILIISE